MTELRRRIGLRVPSVRSLGPPPDPLSVPPRGGVTPNPNPPVGSVGPNVPVAGDPSAQDGAAGGFGATHVMYPADNPPPEVVAWAGWPSEWAVPDWLSPLGSTASLLDVVFAAIDRNASAFASMPPSAVKDGFRLAEQPGWTRNPQPETYTSWHEYAQQTWWAFQLAGEAFTVVTSRFVDNYPRTFMSVPPWLVTVDLRDGQRSYAINGVDVTDDMLHIRYVSTTDNPRGISPLESAVGKIAAVRALQRYATDLAGSGGVPWGVLKTKYRLTKEQAGQLKAQWLEAARARGGAPAVLDNETDLQITQVNPKDMQLVELMQAAEARLSVLLLIPPHMLALPTNAGSMTYANISMIYDEHYRLLRTKIVQLGGAIGYRFLPTGTDLEFDAERYIQPPATDRASYYSTMFGIVDESGARAMTVEEIRRAERIDLLGAPS
jgi:HK97 family phage portal protein